MNISFALPSSLWDRIKLTRFMDISIQLQVPCPFIRFPSYGMNINRCHCTMLSQNFTSFHPKTLNNGSVTICFTRSLNIPALNVLLFWHDWYSSRQKIGASMDGWYIFKMIWRLEASRKKKINKNTHTARTTQNRRRTENMQRCRNIQKW